MSILFIIWLTALFVLSSTLIYAHVRMGKVGGSGYVHAPNDFSEFLLLELRDVATFLRRVLHIARPHGERAAGYIVLMSQRGYDAFFARVFGRTEVMKGKTTSFFLKHISENQDLKSVDKDIPVQ